MNRIRPIGTSLVFSLVAAGSLVGTTQAQILQRLENRIAPGQQVIQQPGTIVQPGTTVIQGAPVVASTTVVPTPTIGSHQIDRFEAIRQLQADVASDANNAANWTILGELAHEVALDVPQGQDDAYYTLSRQAYEKAAALEPANPGLKAALQFAREQEANAATFDAQRRQGVATYLEARRREMAATGINPTLLTYSTGPAAAPTPVPGQVGTTQPIGASYPTPTYQPYYNQQAQQPYGYNQYSNGLTPAPTLGTQAAPVTLRSYGQQLPGVIINQGVRSFGR